MGAKNKTKPKTTLVLTYNEVYGYIPAIYEKRNGNKIIVRSEDYHYRWIFSKNAQADIKLNNKWSDILKSTGYAARLEGIADLENADEVILYAGKSHVEGLLNGAKTIASKKKKVTMVACGCKYEIKKDFKDNIHNKVGIEFIWSECGGEKTLSGLVTKILRGE